MCFDFNKAEIRNNPPKLVFIGVNALPLAKKSYNPWTTFPNSYHLGPKKYVAQPISKHPRILFKVLLPRPSLEQFFFFVQ